MMESPTKSRFFKYNNTETIFHSEKDNSILNGTQIMDDNTILRFVNGKLDGDIFDAEGNYVMTKPAVEAAGHLEYWRKNKLHRDDGFAVISNGFTTGERWIDGKRIE